jgi:golgi phosphoprotein 3
VLTLLEEVVLLTIDPRTGCLHGDQQFSVPYALAGAALFDLALAGRVDTDVDSIQVIDSTPTGNALQDELLAELAGGGAAMSVRGWVEQTFRTRKDLEDRALAQLVDHGLIRLEKTRRLWVIEVQRFPLVDGKPLQLAKERLAQAILDDTIPPTRDIMLVSLTASCGLLNHVLTRDQQEARAERIETLSTVETISRNVSSAIGGLYEDMARGLSGV